MGNKELINVNSSAKRGLIADPKSTYLETHKLSCEFLKHGPNISQNMQLLIGVIWR